MSGLKPKSAYVFVTVFFILITSSLTSTSHVTLTTDGYQNVVVSIEEDSGFISCQEDLENIKVYHFQLSKVENQLTCQFAVCLNRN